ncbi:MAG: glucose-6-phosphate isomerase, partial [Chitinophagaceae bacterium]|nr:glucose-6-phosphate isomerase [Chitinophagaceae bacterium]
MLPKINPTSTQAWQQLQAHYHEIKEKQLRELFKEDTNRFEKLSVEKGDILFDYSKNIITDKTLHLLLQLANDCKLKEAINALFAGDKINATEGRAVLHTALRNFSKEPVFAEGSDVMPLVRKVLKKMKSF